LVIKNKFIIVIIFFIILSTKSFASSFIEVPNLCLKLDKIQKNKIYLKDEQTNCIQGKGLMPINIEKEYTNVDIYINNNYWTSQQIKRFDITNVEDLINKTKEQKIDITKNIHEEKAIQEAKKVANFYHSDSYQKKIETEKDRLYVLLTKKQNNNEQFYQEEKTEKNLNEKVNLDSNERLYIFISSSIPKHTLRNYAFAVNKLKDKNIIFVLRGFINGMKYLEPTVNFIAQLLNKNESCNLLKEQCEMLNITTIVDPLLFRFYDIKQVPAFVYAKNVNIIDFELSEGLDTNTKIGEYYKIYGDVKIDYILKRFYEETNSPSIEGLLNTLIRNKYYNY